MFVPLQSAADMRYALAHSPELLDWASSLAAEPSRQQGSRKPSTWSGALTTEVTKADKGLLTLAQVGGLRG